MNEYPIMIFSSEKLLLDKHSTRSTNFQNCEIEELFINIKECSIARKNYLNHL